MIEFLRKISQFSFSFGRLISFICFTYAGLYLLAFAYFGPDLLSNFKTAILGFCIASIVGAQVVYSRKRLSFDLSVTLAVSLLIFGLPRILEYLSVHPKYLKTLFVLFPVHWTPSRVNTGLQFILIGTLLIIIGINLGEFLFTRFFKKQNLDLEKNYLRPLGKVPELPGLILAGLAVYAVECYYSLYHGMSASNNCIELKAAGSWLIHFFSTDMFALFVLAAFGSRIKQLNRKQVAFLILSTIIYLAIMTLYGSRGGILRVLLFIYALALAKEKDFRLSISMLVIVAPIVLVSSVLIFELGSKIRWMKRDVCTGDGVPFSQTDPDSQGYEASTKMLGENYIYLENKTEELEAAAPDTKKIPFWESVFKRRQRIVLTPGKARVLDRLGVLDYPVGIASVPADPDAQNTYMSFDYIRKNFTNNMVLGTPYPEAQRMTSSMLPILYRHRNIDHVMKFFGSEPLTIWGEAYLFFGYWGGLTFIFLTAILFQLFYLLCAYYSGPYRLFFKFYFLAIIAQGVYYFNFGFDHSAALIIYTILQLSTIWIIALFGDAFFNKCFFRKQTQ